MKSKLSRVVSALTVLAGVLVGPTLADAQTTEVKSKPPLYTYVASFAVPRAKWADVDKQNASEQKTFDKGVSSGGIVGYGDDTAMVHSSDGYTHDSWWSGMSQAGVIGMLEDLEKGGSSTSPAMSAATRHEDALLVSRYYNWKPGAFKGGYTHEASYRLKDTAPDNAIDVLGKSFAVPLLEKLLADGTILEYEIDEEQVHSEAPGRFWVVYITRNAEGLDKASAALDSAFEANPLVGPSLDSLLDSSKHYDRLGRTNGVYK